ncbi:protein Mdm4 isoform 5-T11 [Hipposideros larvatus]
MLPLFDDCCEFQSCSFLCITHCVAHELVSQNGTATSPGLNHFCCTNRYLSLLFRKVQKNAVIPGKVPKKAIFPYHLPHSINAQILEKVIEAGKNDDLEDSESICDDTDVEVASEDEWQCTECKKFNSPSKRYCFRCWALRKDWYSDCSKLTHSLSTSDITAIPEEKKSEGIDIPDCRRTISAPVVRPKDVYRKEENPKLFDPCSSVEFLDLAHSSESQETLSSLGEQSADLLKQRTVIENMEDCRNLLKPCSLCEKRPRDGNIIHGRTSHLVTCFHCARRLKKAGASCPICKKEIQLVIRVFIA